MWWSWSIGGSGQKDEWAALPSSRFRFGLSEVDAMM